MKNTELKDVFISFPSRSDHENLYDEWKLALGYAINDDIPFKDPRVNAGHFYRDDVSKRGNSYFVNKKRVTKNKRHVARIRGNNSTEMPPIPSQTITEVLSKTFHHVDDTLIPHYHTELPDKAPGRLSRNAKKVVTKAVRKIVQKHRLNSQRQKLGSYFIANSRATYDLIYKLNQHCRICTGTTRTRSRGYVSKNLALKVSLLCSEGSNCKLWGSDCGTYVYHSDEVISIIDDDGNTITDYACNIKQAFCSLATPAKSATVRKVLQCLQLEPIGRYKDRKYLRRIWYPNLRRVYSNLQDEKFRILREKDHVVLAMDSSFDCVRHATECTTILCDITSNEVVAIIINTTKIPAVKKEYINSFEVIEMLKNEVKNGGLLIHSITTDKNQAVQKMIQSSGVCKKVKLDNWHVFSKFEKHAVTVADKLKSSILGVVGSSGKSLDRDPFAGKRDMYTTATLISSITDEYEKKCKTYFDDYERQFARSDHKDLYDKVRFNVEKEKAWMSEHGLAWNSDVESLSIEQCTKIIEIYNEHYETKPKMHINVIQELKIAKVPNALLKKIYQYLKEITGFSPEAKKDKQLEQLQKVLPDDCFKGTLWSSEVLPAAKEAAKLPLRSDCDLIRRRRVLDEIKGSIRRRFGVKADSTVETMNETRDSSGSNDNLTDDLYTEICSLAEGIELAETATYEEKLKFCQDNLWRLDDDNQITKEAAEIACSMFKERKRDLRHYYGQMIRLVNELYGSYSERFKVYVVINALLNYNSHWSNDHSKCNQFMWYSRCGVGCTAPNPEDARLGRYMFIPDKCYICEDPSVKARRHDPLLDELIPLFFKFYVYAFTLSIYNEGLIYKIIDNTRTSICESFNHHDRQQRQKVNNYLPEEAIHKGKMSFISFDSNQKQKCRNSTGIPSLVSNKYADSLIPIQFSEKISGDYSYIQNFLDKVLGSYSETTKLNAERRLDKIANDMEKREQRNENKRNKVFEDEVVTNLNIRIAQQLSVDSMDPLCSGRPCPPFPFPYKNYRKESEVANNIFMSVVSKTIEIRQKTGREVKTTRVECCICKDDGEDGRKQLTECIGNCKKYICVSCQNGPTTDDARRWTDSKKYLQDDTLMTVEVAEDEEELLCPECFSKLDRNDDNDNMSEVSDSDIAG